MSVLCQHLTSGNIQKRCGFLYALLPGKIFCDDISTHFVGGNKLKSNDAIFDQFSDEMVGHKYMFSFPRDFWGLHKFDGGSVIGEDNGRCHLWE